MRCGQRAELESKRAELLRRQEEEEHREQREALVAQFVAERSADEVCLTLASHTLGTPTTLLVISDLADLFGSCMYIYYIALFTTIAYIFGLSYIFHHVTYMHGSWMVAAGFETFTRIEDSAISVSLWSGFFVRLSALRR